MPFIAMRRLGMGLLAAVVIGGAALAQGADDLSGTYQVSGVNPDGGGNYAADIKVQLVGDVYQLEWASAGQKAVGAGLRLGDTLAVTWQDPSTKESAVAAYIIMPDGGLKGRWAPIGAKAAGTEDWARKP